MHEGAMVRVRVRARVKRERTAQTTDGIWSL